MEGEEFQIQNVDDIGMRINRKACEAMNAPHKFAIRARVIRGPAPSLWRKEVASAKLGTMVWLRFCHRAPCAHSVFPVPQAREIELGIIAGSMRDSGTGDEWNPRGKK